jgi:hypothetical protein
MRFYIAGDGLREWLALYALFYNWFRVGEATRKAVGTSGADLKWPPVQAGRHHYEGSRRYDRLQPLI